MSDKHPLPGGATRSEEAPAYHLNPGLGSRRTAIRFGTGAKIHGPWNWTRSIIAGRAEAYAFCTEAYNHMMEHARKMAAGQDPEDDHLGAIGWAQEVLAYAEHYWGERWPKLRHPGAGQTSNDSPSSSTASLVGEMPLQPNPTVAVGHLSSPSPSRL